MEYDIYLNECFEIEAALESLLNLSDIVDDIAMEAPTATAAVVDRKKENLAVKKMADAWLAKFDAWGKKFDKPVKVSADLDEHQITKKVNELYNRYYNTYDNEAAIFKYQSDHAEYTKEVIKALQKELAKVDPNDETVTKSGLFKALRSKIASVIKKSSAQDDKEGYAKAIRDQIAVANKIMTNLDKISKSHYTQILQIDSAKTAIDKASEKLRRKDDERVKNKKKYLSSLTNEDTSVSK